MSTRKKPRRPSLKGSLNPSKRHRDRVNVELDNLAKLLPFAPEVIAKLDKLSVLRLSASYLRTKNFFKGLNVGSKLKTPETTTLDDFEKTGAISELLVEALDGFLMVLTQDVEVFYASETIGDYLGVSQASVIHQDFMRFVHIDDQHMLNNNLKLVPSQPEKKIREITDDIDVPCTEGSVNEPDENGKEVSKERSFICRLKCILNTNAGFFKPFKCHGRLREVDSVDASCPQLALFLICSPLEMATSIVEVRMKSMLFCTKNKLDLTFVDIDQKGRQIVGYTKKDISAQSSYCMMHFDDIPVLRKMHHDLMATGKCEGVFRWLNKQNKWQWLSGSGQVIFKNNRPDFVITTNKPLTDEEGEDEVRRRERELGIIPTSPASLLAQLQVASSGTGSRAESDLHLPQLPLNTSDPNVVPPQVSPNLSTTSCTSDPFPPEDLPLDLNADFFLEENDSTWESQASLSDLDCIGKADLVGDLFDLNVNDLNLDELNKSNTVPLTHVSDSAYTSVEPSSNSRMQWPDPWIPRDHEITPQYSQRPQVSRPTIMTSTYNNYGTPRFSTSGIMPPPTGGSSSQRMPLDRGALISQGMPQSNGVHSQNTPGNRMCRQAQLINVSDIRDYQAAMAPPRQQLPLGGNIASSQVGLLKLQAQPMINPPYIKTEPARASGYYCNSASTDPVVSGGLMNSTLFPGVSLQGNTNSYQNRLNHIGPPQWATAPPSPYSSGSSSTSSYDALHVQFSPTELLPSPFASPLGDNDYNHGNVAPPVPLRGQPYSNLRHPQRSIAQPPPSFPQQFVDIPEIAPVGMVKELVPGMHNTSPITSRTTAGLTHL